MTVSTATRSISQAGNGSTTVFAIPFPFQAQADIVATLIDNSTLVETAWTLGVNFTLSGGDPTGTLTATVAPASGTTLLIERTVSYVQTLDLTANDALPAESIEDALDHVTMMIQQLADGVGGGSSGTIELANIGAGNGVVAGLVGQQYQLKSLVQGSNVTITNDADEITIAASAPGETNTASNLGAGSGVYASKSGVDLRFKSLVAGTNITLTPGANDITIAATSGVAGETNTGSNLGTGSDVFKSKVGVDLQFRRLNAGANVSVTQNANDITIAATGEANTASNVGVTGVGLWASKVGVDLRFKGLAVGLGLSQATSATDITHSINQAAALTWTAVETFDRVPGAGSHSVVMKGHQSGAMPDGNVVVADSRYTSMLSIQRTVDITAAGQSISAGSTAGNALVYGQMQIPAATGGALGTAPYGYRFTVEASYTRGGGLVNSPTAGYLSIYNGGRSLGAFGLHVDAYHQGSDSAGGGGNTTYGISCEMFKRDDPTAVPGTPNGVAAIYVGRSDQNAVTAHKVDFGMVLVSAGTSPGFRRGLQLGSPSYANGGIAGAASSSTFDVGIDLSHGTYTYAAAQIRENDYVIWSGQQLAQSATPITSCRTRWRSATGNWVIDSAGTEKWGVNMTDGRMFLTSPTTTSATAGGASALPALPTGYLTVNIGGTDRKIPYYS